MAGFPTPRKWFPTKPEKYIGDVSKIISRSSWETKFMIWCDNNSAIVSWSSEETVVPYRCATDNKPHRYFLDFRIQVKQSSGLLKTYLIEIKPHGQTLPPVNKGRKTKRFLTESLTFLKNQSKWAAADRFAKDRGWEFMILTEHHLFGK
jgi:hypothetical protein